jgi:antitoxin ParD1/3/4
MTAEPTQTLTVSLPSRQVNRIHRAVDAGDYLSDSDVMRAALQLWEKSEERRAAEDARLKRAYDEGIASGPGKTIDPVAFLAELKEKAAKRG